MRAKTKPPELQWLDGPPTEPGLYWYLLQGSQAVRHCEVAFVRGCLRTYTDGWVPVAQMKRKWAGPMPKPEAPCR